MKRTILAISLAATLLAIALSCLPELSLDHIGPVCGNGLIEYDAGEECESNGSPTGCTDCKVTCDGYKDDASLHCYYVAPQRARTVFSAHGTCQNSGGLVHVSSLEEHKAIVDNLKAPLDAGAFSPFFVALQQASGEKIQTRWEPLVAGVAGWSPTCPACYAGTPARLIAEQPDAGDGGCGCASTLQCVAASAANQIVPIGCVTDRALGVVCERNPTGKHTTLCPDAGGACISLASTHHEKRYVLVSQEVKAGEVADTCKRIGATPAVFHTALEREEIAEAVSELGASTFKFWIGLSKVDGSWTWADGVSATNAEKAGRPSVFADSAEVLEATDGMRALITVTTGQPLLDNGLAHVQPASKAAEGSVSDAAVLCQLP